MRIKAIDNFRGLGILLMVFFSIIFRLSDSLPDLLIHNVPDSLHLGDFVLPMFIFASGMSIVFFAKKRGGKKKSEYVLDIVERFGKLAGIAILLSPFSAGGFFQMDEVMLSALLFIPTVILLSFSEIAMMAAIIVVFGLYFGLQAAGMLPDFSAHYLGGYAAAVFYLPVMLGGVLAAKRMEQSKKLLVASAIVSILLILIIPPYKMSTTPSFMALSVTVSLAIFAALKHVESAALDYLGRKPLRYWVLMFVVLIVPISFYGIGTGAGLPLPLGWVEALLITIITMPLLYLISKGADYLRAG